MKTKYLKLLSYLFVTTSLLTFVIFKIIPEEIYITLDIQQRWALFCFCFLAVWWIIYFRTPRSRIWSLRLFLRKRNPDRASESNNAVEGTIITKAGFIIGNQSMYMAVIALFLGITLQNDNGTYYYIITQYLAIITALVSILLMVFAVDILDTVTNRFEGGEKDFLGYRKWFFSELGPIFPKGGASYAYLGYTIFTVFFIVAISTFHPVLASFGVAIYTYLGFPFLFGYKGKQIAGNDYEIEVDLNSKSCLAISFALGAFFLLVPVILYYYPKVLSLLG